METAKELELVRRMKKGERAAFDELYEQYYDKLFRTACMITGNRADGEDVTQETFIKAYLNCGKLKKEEQFRYWLYKILNRTAWQIAKKHAKSVRRSIFWSWRILQWQILRQKRCYRMSRAEQWQQRSGSWNTGSGSPSSSITTMGSARKTSRGSWNVWRGQSSRDCSRRGKICGCSWSRNLEMEGMYAGQSVHK